MSVYLFLASNKALIYCPSSAVDERMQRNVKTEKHESLVGVHGQFTQNLSSLKEVRRLDQLIEAHTLLAIMSDRSSPEHEHNLLQAYTFVLQIWQVFHHLYYLFFDILKVLSCSSVMVFIKTIFLVHYFSPISVVVCFTWVKKHRYGILF